MELTSRVAELEKKVKELERQVGELLRNQPNHTIPEPNQAERTPPLSEPVPPHIQPPPQEVRPAVKKTVPPRDWEHLIARVWLPRIFIVVFLLGVLWGFTAAVSAGILTEPVRCMLGVAAACFMIWQGEKQIRHKHAALGQVLLGGAMGVLILSLFAAHMLYELIPSNWAFILYIITIALSVYSAVRHRSQALMIITLLAGYLVPFLVDSINPHIWVFAGYEGLFSMSMMVLSLRYSFRGAYFTAFWVLHLPLLIIALFDYGTNDRAALLTIVILQHLLIFTISVVRAKEPRIGQRILLFLSFSLLATWSYGLYGSSNHSNVYEWLLVIGFLLYGSTSFWLHRQKNAFSVQASIATFSALLWIIYVLHGNEAGSAIVVEGAFALCLGVAFRSKLQQISGAITFFIGMLFVFAHPLHDVLSEESLAWLILVASIFGMYAYFRFKVQQGLVRVQLSLSLVWLALVLLLVYLTQLTNALTRSLDFDYQHSVLSAVWAVYAILLIVIGHLIHKPKARLVGIIFLFITLLKIIFIDLPDVSTAIRAVLFIGLGAIGVGISRLFYKRKE
ncbi:DUF2339 domain-containing protein [Paenibacillus alba]|uniref:DUF2339 domain-containing protein n=1 Tax=Paenibacillus alba TaxID=1197127 RepID=UPI0015664B6A|nr:DUF2339 domain-containing protein [Paenibacillus alba]NQX71214.1 DUF2339 domain-containing protein [Paenibacillus alba]